MIEGKEKDTDVRLNASRKAKDVRSNYVTASDILTRPFLQIQRALHLSNWVIYLRIALNPYSSMYIRLFF